MLSRGAWAVPASAGGRAGPSSLLQRGSMARRWLGPFVDEGLPLTMRHGYDQQRRRGLKPPPEPCAQVRILPGAPSIRCPKTPSPAETLRPGSSRSAGVCRLEWLYVRACGLFVEGIRRPEVLVGLVARHGVTHTLTVPSFYAELLHTVREDERLARDLASLRLVICAGEGCPGHHPETLVAPGRVRGPPRCLLH
ncbi:AMP-binding protein [Streptomyces sp. NPDC004065]|uniref:AMP-binding protein n=1 Tax=Streptomyces sp. NPDC004065 TaxID=3364689 RepID=UPI00384BD86B